MKKRKCKNAMCACTGACRVPEKKAPTFEIPKEPKFTVPVDKFFTIHCHKCGAIVLLELGKGSRTCLCGLLYRLRRRGRFIHAQVSIAGKKSPRKRGVR